MGQNSPFLHPILCLSVCDRISAAIAISQKIIDGEPEIVEKYKKFLSGGSSMDRWSFKNLRSGYDQPAAVTEALRMFERYLEEMESLTLK